MQRIWKAGCDHGIQCHPLTSIAGILIARRFHVPAIVEVRDLWPEAIFSVGKVKMNSLQEGAECR